MERPDDICPRPVRLGDQPTEPLAPPIHLTSVWICADTDQAEQTLGGTRTGYVYQREGHPNADVLAEKCRTLHHADAAAVTASGMSALALALLTQTQPGDHILLSHMLYGRSLYLFSQEAQRLGITNTLVDPTDHDAVARAITPNTKLLVVETIGNPCLAVADIGALANLAHHHGLKLLVDNTFATPVLCRPLDFGADLVMESVSKMMNGHSDVMLGLLCGKKSSWERVPTVLSAWGLASAPFDCWLSLRGMATLPLRFDRACANAMCAAEFLARQPAVASVNYPGLANHPQHVLATRQFAGRYGSIVTFHLRGGRAAADKFIAATSEIPFCPSLGEVSTTLSHPESTSHRGLTPAERAALGITGGTIRLSVGIESSDFILEALSAIAGL